MTSSSSRNHGQYTPGETPVHVYFLAAFAVHVLHTNPPRLSPKRRVQKTPKNRDSAKNSPKNAPFHARNNTIFDPLARVEIRMGRIVSVVLHLQQTRKNISRAAIRHQPAAEPRPSGLFPAQLCPNSEDRTIPARKIIVSSGKSHIIRDL